MIHSLREITASHKKRGCIIFQDKVTTPKIQKNRQIKAVEKESAAMKRSR